MWDMTVITALLGKGRMHLFVGQVLRRFGVTRKADIVTTGFQQFVIVPAVRLVTIVALAGLNRHVHGGFRKPFVRLIVTLGTQVEAVGPRQMVMFRAMGDVTSQALAVHGGRMGIGPFELFGNIGMAAEAQLRWFF
jgi:hypothetical protein